MSSDTSLDELNLNFKKELLYSNSKNLNSRDMISVDGDLAADLEELESGAYCDRYDQDAKLLADFLGEDDSAHGEELKDPFSQKRQKRNKD